MKETKSFFTHNNRLNRGYVNSSDVSESDSDFYRRKFEHILPPAEVMREYESMYPGTVERLVAMAQKEQSHRHMLDLRNLKASRDLSKISKICALIISVFSLILLSFILGVMGSYIAVCVVFLLGLSTFCIIKFVVNHTRRRCSEYGRKKYK